MQYAGPPHPMQPIRQKAPKMAINIKINITRKWDAGMVTVPVHYMDTTSSFLKPDFQNTTERLPTLNLWVWTKTDSESR